MKKTTIVSLCIVASLSPWNALALEPEERVLLPTAGRSPADAGLESGRYESVDLKDIKEWERKQNLLLEESDNVGQDFPRRISSPKLEE